PASSSARADSKDSARTGKKPGCDSRPVRRRRTSSKARSTRDRIMPIRNYKPTSAGRRFQSVQTFDEITTSRPHKPLVETLERSGGRNNSGTLTSWWRGGGHRRNYRLIDFKRDKFNVPGKITTVEYDPNRTARIALVTYADGEKRYILHPLGLKVGDPVMSGDNCDILPGNCLRLKNIPLGTMIHNVELKQGK